MKSWRNILLRAGFRSTPTSLTTGQYICLHTWPFPTLACAYTAFVCTYICTPGLFQYCICTPGLFLYLHLHTLFSLFSLSIGTPGLCQYRSTSAHLALSVHVSVHLAFVSTCICTPVCEVSMPHRCTCGFQPVG